MRTMRGPGSRGRRRSQRSCSSARPWTRRSCGRGSKLYSTPDRAPCSFGARPLPVPASAGSQRRRRARGGFLACTRTFFSHRPRRGPTWPYAAQTAMPFATLTVAQAAGGEAIVATSIPEMYALMFARICSPLRLPPLPSGAFRLCTPFIPSADCLSWRDPLAAHSAPFAQCPRRNHAGGCKMARQYRPETVRAVCLGLDRGATVDSCKQ
eukprot:UN4016